MTEFFTTHPCFAFLLMCMAFVVLLTWGVAIGERRRCACPKERK